MLITEFGIMIDFKLLQPEKANSPICKREFDNVIDDNDVHLWKTALPILVTDFGIIIDDNSVQLSKVKSPIFVSEFDNATDDNDVHPEKTALPILVTEFGKVIVPKLTHSWNV